MVPFGVTVTIIPQTVDNFGNRTAGTSVDVEGCAVWQTPGVETVGGQDTLVYDVTVLLPPGTVVHATDRMTIGDVTYEVVTQAIEWRSPLSSLAPGVEVHVRRVDG